MIGWIYMVNPFYTAFIIVIARTKNRCMHRWTDRLTDKGYTICPFPIKENNFFTYKIGVHRIIQFATASDKYISGIKLTKK